MKAAVEQIREAFAFSERHACGLMKLPVSTFRYRSFRNDQALRQDLIELARQRPRFGYRRLHVNVRFRGKCLNANLFSKLADARGQIAA